MKIKVTRARNYNTYISITQLGIEVNFLQSRTGLSFIANFLTFLTRSLDLPNEWYHIYVFNVIVHCDNIGHEGLIII